MNRHWNQELGIIIKTIILNEVFILSTRNILLYQSRNKHGYRIWSPYRFDYNAWNQKSFFLRDSIKKCYIKVKLIFLLFL